MERKYSFVKCPKCGDAAREEVCGDLDSGWSGEHWGEGTYTEGVISWQVDCPNCGYHHDDVEIHD